MFTDSFPYLHDVYQNIILCLSQILAHENFARINMISYWNKKEYMVSGSVVKKILFLNDTNSGVYSYIYYTHFNWVKLRHSPFRLVMSVIIIKMWVYNSIKDCIKDPSNLNQKNSISILLKAWRIPSYQNVQSKV